MKRLLLVVIIFFSMTGLCFADAYEAVTIDNTSGGVGLTAATYGINRYALCRLETANIRYTKDGATAPTDAIGMILYVGDYLTLDSPDQIRNFKGYRTTASSGSLKCHYTME